MKNRFLTAILVSTFALAPGAQGKSIEAASGGHICTVRPDLCGGPVRAKKRPHKRPHALRKIKVKAATINFDAYLQNNSNHPAITRQPSSINQTAFPTPERKPAAITGSSSSTPEPEKPVPAQDAPPPPSPNQ